jgi:hypothetical protein
MYVRGNVQHWVASPGGDAQEGRMERACLDVRIMGDRCEIEKERKP